MLDLPCLWTLIASDPEFGGILPHTMLNELREATEKTRGQMFEMAGVGHDSYREDFEGFVSLLHPSLRSIS